jgi:outer membrane protein assembly factor BamB
MNTTKNLRHCGSCIAILLSLCAAHRMHGQSAEPLSVLVPRDSETASLFGIDIDIDDGVVVVGAFGGNAGDVECGTAYVFEAESGKQLYKLIPPEPRKSLGFGWSVAIGSDVIAVGAIYDDGKSDHSGAVYLFDAKTGELRQKIFPDDGRTQDEFGSSLAIDGDLVAVSHDSHNESREYAGAVYVFDIHSGEQLLKVSHPHNETRNYFGRAIDLSAGLLAVGDPKESDERGAVYIFDAETGTLQHTYHSRTRMKEDRFGLSVSFSDGIVAVGSPYSDTAGSNAGSTELFECQSEDAFWEFIPSDAIERFGSGNSVAIDNGTVIVGAPRLPYGCLIGEEPPGAVYIFDADTGLEGLKLRDKAQWTGDSFGAEVAIDGGLLVVAGSTLRKATADRPNVFVYDLR